MIPSATQTFRPAASDDWPVIERLLLARGLPTEGAHEHQDGFLVAEERGRVVGCIGVERYGAVGLLRSLAVAEETAGRGVGTALVRALLDSVSRLGVKELYLLTTTAPNYFPRFGFGVVDRSALPKDLETSAELRGACPASAVAMRLPVRA